MEIQVIKILTDTIVDGPGFRTSIYCAGCYHKCPGCQNPHTWSKSAGISIDVQEIFELIKKNDFNDVTFSGGDPFYQAEAFTELAKLIKQHTDKTIWCFTGFTYEELIEIPEYVKLLRYIDVLVDGPFMEELADTSLKFRGSSNQRILELHEGKLKQVVGNI